VDWQISLDGLQGGWAILVSAALILAAVLGGWALNRVLFFFLLRAAGRPETTKVFGILVNRWRKPARFLLPLLVLVLIAPVLRFPQEVLLMLRQVFSLFVIGVIAWLLASSALGLRDLIISSYDVTVQDNLKARIIHTQIDVLVKIVLVVIVVIAAASMLMVFDPIRQLGVSILASAGIIGVIAGFAAQRSIATLFAGIQIALTQPIRLDDVLIVEGEWGRVEEITLTYVVVRIWDQRRLIVPITYFLEKPFQNWTRVSADILGTVFIYTDYTVPVEEVRQELHRLLQTSEFWDGKVWGVQVTHVSERTMELRALMSADDSGRAWNLRCEIREKLLDFLQKNYPQSLPRIRAEVDQGKGTPDDF
jgi:small-conductance mechanosensitive channel